MQEHKSDYQQEQNDVSIKKVIQMRLYIFLISIVCCTGISRAQYNPQINELKWSDEFNYEGVPDPAKWSYEEGLVRNEEAQYYTKEREKNVRVENGCLVIEAHKEKYGNMEYTSGSIHTNDKLEFSGGRIEARVKVPAGKGTWPAIWTLGHKWPDQPHPACGEIDILEYVGYMPKEFFVNVHTPADCQKERHSVNVYGTASYVENAAEDFHIFALEWYEDCLKFFVDEKCTYEYHKDPQRPDHWRFDFDNPQFLILNLAIGGVWGGEQGIDDSIFPVKYYVDWVRYYK